MWLHKTLNQSQVYEWTRTEVLCDSITMILVNAGGEVVEITLSGNAANVRLLDNSNLSSYRNGRQHRYYGGLVRKSPIRLPIPRSGHWHVTVDMQGLRGNVRSSARVLPSALPPLQEAPQVPSLVKNTPFDDYPDTAIEYDVFISHASEDKDAIVRPMANALAAEGLVVWYDEFELRIGDSLRRDHSPNPGLGL